MLVIGPEQFVELYLAIMSENKRKKINLEEMSETIKALYSSSEFSSFVKKLNIEHLIADIVISNRFVKSFNEDGTIEFFVFKKEREKILSTDGKDTTSLKNAIAKVTLANYIDKTSGGMISFKYDDPSGEYDLPYDNSIPFQERETKIFTDGVIINNEIKRGKELYSKTRSLKIDGATYTILIDYLANKPLAAEIRSTSQGDYLSVINQTQRLMNGINDAFEEVDKEKPKGYRLKKH